MKDSEILAEQGLRDIYYDPSEGYQSAERLYRDARAKRLGVSRRMVRGMVKDSGHVHEVQAHRQETQVSKDLREISRGSGATGPGGHVEVRKQEQRLPLDPGGRRDSEPVSLYDTRLQEGHQKHDEGRRTFVGKV